MKHCLHRTVCFLLLTLLLLLVSSAALAMVDSEYIVVDKELIGAKWDDKANAPSITEGISYKYTVRRSGAWSEYTQNTYYYYKFIPPETQTYFISNNGWRVRICDSNGNAIFNGEEINTIDIQLQTGQVYYIGVNHGYFDAPDSNLAICTEDCHPQSGIFEDVSMPSCDAPGIQRSLCQFCGGVAVTRESAPAKGHTPGEWKQEQDPTCAQEGLRAQRCTTCGDIIASEPIEKLPHTPGENQITQPANCLKEGISSISCTQCGEVLSSETLPLVPHTPDQMNVLSPATCTEKGFAEQRCTTCNTLLSTEELPMLNHTSGQWTTQKEPTCMNEGKQVLCCRYCNLEMDSTILPKTDHYAGIMTIVSNPTCTDEGYAVQRCTECNVQLNQETLPALGHKGV